MAEIYVVTALRNHARGMKVSGLGDRVYQVNPQTGLLHYCPPNSLPSDQARVHPDDAAEFRQFPNDYKVEKVAESAQAAPAKKMPPPPPSRHETQPEATTPFEEPAAEPPAPPKRLDPFELPPEAATWSHSRLITEAKRRHVKLSKREEGLQAPTLLKHIKDHLAEMKAASEPEDGDPVDPDEDDVDSDEGEE